MGLSLRAAVQWVHDLFAAGDAVLENLARIAQVYQVRQRSSMKMERVSGTTTTRPTVPPTSTSPEA